MISDTNYIINTKKVAVRVTYRNLLLNYQKAENPKNEIQWWYLRSEEEVKDNKWTKYEEPVDSDLDEYNPTQPVNLFGGGTKYTYAGVAGFVMFFEPNLCSTR